MKIPALLLGLLFLPQTDHELRIRRLEAIHNINVCGNRTLEPDFGEACDDGNLLNGDGCDSACQVEAPPPPPPPPPPTGSPYDALIPHLPPAGQFKKIPGSEIGSVLVGATEFPFCDQIGCWKSQNSFLAWVGMALDEATGRWWNPAGGGHADYGGNEVYRWNFSTLSWSRETQPKPLTGPFMLDANGDGVKESCPAPEVGPAADHTYDGVLYVPTRNEILFMPTVPFCIGAMATSQGFWIFNPSTLVWTHHPEFTDTGYAKLAWDPDRGVIYAFAGAGSARLYEIDPAANYAATLKANYGWLGDGTAWFDPMSRLLYSGTYSAGLRRVPISAMGVLGAEVGIVDWSETGGVPLRFFANHTPTGDLVFWVGDNRIWRYTPSTDQIILTTVTAGELPTGESQAIYSKWIYLDAVDAFVGIDDPREGVWLYKLPDAAPPPPPPPDGAQSFLDRCNAPGVVLCDPLDTEGPWGVGRRFMPNPDGTQGIPTGSWNTKWRGVQNSLVGSVPGAVMPRLDTAVKVSGTGSLKFDYPQYTNEGGGGNFTTNFSDDPTNASGNAVLFGEGERFYVQFRWRASCDLIYLDCDPTSAAYKTARRTFAAAGGGTTAFKLAIISGGDVNLPTNQPHCDWLQQVLVHTFDHALAAYESCLWYEGYQEFTGENWGGSLQLDYQPNAIPRGLADATSPTCWYVPNAPTPGLHAWGNTGPDCFYLEPDEWITMQMMIAVGTFTDPARAGPKTSHVSLWAAREGEPQRLIIDVDAHIPREFAYEKFGKVTLLPFMTGKDPMESHPTGHVWYDELIVSRQFIADPAWL